MAEQRNVVNVPIAGSPRFQKDAVLAISRLKASLMSPTSEPTFSGITLTGLTGSRLVSTDDDKEISSTDLVNWVSGTNDEIDVQDDGNGGITIGITDPLIVAKGGTGAASLTDGGLLLGSGTGAITALAQATNGQLPIGNTGSDPTLATLTGTSNQITVTNDAGSITLSTPQDIDTTCDFQASSITLTDTIQVYSAVGTPFIRTDHGLIVGEGSGISFTTGNGFIFGNNCVKNATAATGVFAIGNYALEYCTAYSVMGVGAAAGRYNTTGSENLYFGREAGKFNQVGWNNTIVGDKSGYGSFGLSDIDRNILIGGYVGYGCRTGFDDNVIVGYLSARDVTTAKENSLYGSASGRHLSTGSGDVFIGFKSGFNQTTGSNLLIIDNQDRSSVANELVNSLIYGVFDAASANQSIRINGYLITKEAITGLERSSDPTQPSEGEYVIWMSDGTGYGDDGDICAASTAGGNTRKVILFDFLAGDTW